MQSFNALYLEQDVGLSMRLFLKAQKKSSGVVSIREYIRNPSLYGKKKYVTLNGDCNKEPLTMDSDFIWTCEQLIDTPKVYGSGPRLVVVALQPISPRSRVTSSEVMYERLAKAISEKVIEKAALL